MVATAFSNARNVYEAAAKNGSGSAALAFSACPLLLRSGGTAECHYLMTTCGEMARERQRDGVLAQIRELLQFSEEAFSDLTGCFHDPFRQMCSVATDSPFGVLVSHRYASGVHASRMTPSKFHEPLRNPHAIMTPYIPRKVTLSFGGRAAEPPIKLHLADVRLFDRGIGSERDLRYAHRKWESHVTTAHGRAANVGWKESFQVASHDDLQAMRTSRYHTYRRWAGGRDLPQVYPEISHVFFFRQVGTGTSPFYEGRINAYYVACCGMTPIDFGTRTFDSRDISYLYNALQQVFVGKGVLPSSNR
jgi:hypothetical protein